MNRTEAFQILEIERTKDEGAIRDAYRKKLAVTNPEDDPEGFKKLRAAYEEARRFAREAETPEEQSDPRDTSPSGLWVGKAEKIYGNIRTRQDADAWKRLFDEDVFVSLEEEENCRMKLLKFLAEHYRLPTEIWRLLDKKLSIVSDAAALREKFPADYLHYITDKCQRGEDVDFKLFEGAEDAEYDLFFRYYERSWQLLQEGKTEEAGQTLEKADALGIRHPVLEICRAGYLRAQGKADEAIELLEGQYGRYPKDSMLAYNLAELLWREGKSGKKDCIERAAQIYMSLKEENDRHYIANVRLTEWYCEKGQYREAKKCAEKVLVSGGDDDFLEVLGRVNAEIEKELEVKYRADGGWEPALELCWCYLQDGKISGGLRLAAAIEKLLPPGKEAEYYGLLAKLYVEEAEYEDSIVMTHNWQEALEEKLPEQEEGEEKERNRDRLAQARLIRVQCYHNMGFQDREYFALAVKEAKQLLTGTAKDVGVLLEMVQLYTEMEEYELGLELVQKLLTEYQIFAAHASALEIYRRQLDAGGVLREGGQCLKYFPTYVKAYEYMAKVCLDLDYKQELEKFLADAEKNGVKSVILDAYRFQMKHELLDTGALRYMLQGFRKNYLKKLEDGQQVFYEQGLKRLTEYLYRYPTGFMLVERGNFHRAAHHPKEAREDYEKALALYPADAEALMGLSLVCKDTGDFEKALFYIKRSILYKDKNASPKIYAEMGDIYALLGDFRKAIASYKQYFQEAGGKWNVVYERNMFQFQAQLGQVDEEVKFCEAAYGSDKSKSREYYERLAELYMKSGMEAETREVMKKWEAYLKACHSGYAWTMIKKLLLLPDQRIYREMSELAAYYRSAGWTEMIFGTTEAAVAAFEKMFVCANDGQSGAEEKLADAVFACILCGDEAKGKKYAKKLLVWRNRQTFAGTNIYHDRQKSLVWIEFLAKYYMGAAEDLQKVLDRGAACEICRQCVNPVCRMMESAGILLLLRQGRREEAAERVRKSLELQPWDEYMRAIRHVAFGDEA